MQSSSKYECFRVGACLETVRYSKKDDIHRVEYVRETVVGDQVITKQANAEDKRME